MKREKHFWKKLFCFVFLFTVVTGCGSVYAAEHGTVEEKETEDRSGMLEDELEQMEESLLDEFDFRQIDQLSGETELGEKVRFRDLTEMLISGNTQELGERFLEFFSGQVFSVFQKGRKNLARLLLEKTDILLLDEPTNHLDVDAKEALKQALIEYKGSILLICHEPEFYRDVVSQVWDCSKWTTKIL